MNLRKVKPEELEALRDRADADDHRVLFPSHVAEKNGEIVGYVSLGMVPVVNWWMDSEKVMVRDSLQVFSMVEALMDFTDVSFYFMPCESESPYYPDVMSGCGFENLGATNLFIKKVGG